MKRLTPFLIYGENMHRKQPGVMNKISLLSLSPERAAILREFDKNKATAVSATREKILPAIWDHATAFIRHGFRSYYEDQEREPWNVEELDAEDSAFMDFASRISDIFDNAGIDEIAERVRTSVELEIWNRILDLAIRDFLVTYVISSGD